MAELRTEHQVKAAMRTVFATAAGLPDPTIIVDSSNLYDPPPPADDLGFPAPPAQTMGSLLTLVAGDLIGGKMTMQFASILLPPDLGGFTTFGSLAIEMHRRVNRFAERAVFLAICEALERDPAHVPQSMAIRHPNRPGARAFARRLAHAIGSRICAVPSFHFTKRQELEVMADTTVKDLVGLVVKILAKKGCLS